MALPRDRPPCCLSVQSLPCCFAGQWCPSDPHGASWEGLLHSPGLPLVPDSLIRGKGTVVTRLLINVLGEEVSVVWSSTPSLL